MRTGTEDKRLKRAAENKHAEERRRLYRTRDGRLVPEFDPDAYQLVLSGYEDDATRKRVAAEYGVQL